MIGSPGRRSSVLYPALRERHVRPPSTVGPARRRSLASTWRHRPQAHGRWLVARPRASTHAVAVPQGGTCLLRTAQRTRASSSIVDVFVISKLLRANGECLGDYYRRRTWVAAKSHGAPPTRLSPVDVRMGKPGTRNGVSLPPEHIGRVEGTG